MKPILPILLCVAGCLTACQSTQPPSGRQRPYVPRVSVPEELSNSEARHLPDVEDVLLSRGYRTVHNGQPAEYQLDFNIDDGPVNADTHMALRRGRQELASSYARVGGPRILVRRNQVIQESVDKCLTDFESRIPAPTQSYGGQGGFDDFGSGYSNWQQPAAQANSQPAQEYSQQPTGSDYSGSADDWQTGWDNH